MLDAWDWTVNDEAAQAKCKTQWMESVPTGIEEHTWFKVYVALSRVTLSTQTCKRTVQRTTCEETTANM